MSDRRSFRTSPHLLGLITLIGRLMQEQVNASLGKLELTYAQAVALVRLWRTEEGALPQSTLIASLAVSRASGSQMLADLENRGLVGRQVHESDARRQVVTLTDRGKSLERPVLEIFDRAEAALLEGVAPADKKLTHEALRRMLRNAESQRRDAS